MYFKDKGNTDIDEELKYSDNGNGRNKSIWPYVVFGTLFLVGIILIYIGSKL